MGWPLFIFPPFVLWPVWGILIIRSPWHDQTLIRGLAWAMLIVGSVLEVRNFRDAPQGPEFVLALLAPGIVITVMTQVMWSRYRLEHGLVPPPMTPWAGEERNEILDREEYTEEDGYTRRYRVRRRLQRRRSKSDRSSRH